MTYRFVLMKLSVLETYYSNREFNLVLDLVISFSRYDSINRWALNINASNYVYSCVGNERTVFKTIISIEAASSFELFLNVSLY